MSSTGAGTSAAGSSRRNTASAVDYNLLDPRTGKIMTMAHLKDMNPYTDIEFDGKKRKLGTFFAYFQVMAVYVKTPHLVCGRFVIWSRKASDPKVPDPIIARRFKGEHSARVPGIRI